MIRKLAVAVVPFAVLLSACEPGPRALWLMNETSGSTMFDSAGDHDGTATNVVFGQPGHEGASYGFNGIDSIVRVPTADDLNPGGNDFSFGAWVNFSQLPPPPTWDVVRKGVSGTTGGYYKLELFTGSSGARARCYLRDGAGASTSVVRGTGLNDGRWHQLTCSRTGSTISLTVDSGTSSNTASLGSVANGDDLTIGAKATGGDVFNGLIDDVRLSVG